VREAVQRRHDERAHQVHLTRQQHVSDTNDYKTAGKSERGVRRASMADTLFNLM
jgi:hypothetical protein